ncbi:MAG: 4-(cytidine 5'-diphospho)-2-C-methyl-D-erythritol kinase [Hyphomonas sp.]
MLSELAPAKVNLFLHVDRVKPNGRHDLQSLVVFAGAEAADEVFFSPGSALSLRLTGEVEDLVADCDDNLVLQAARGLLKASDNPGTGQFVLRKDLPVAAGIGGGSADAAAALRLLLHAFEIDPAVADALAPSLGGDVPVALRSSAANMLGEGERVSAVTLPAPIPAVLVNPRIPCPTGPIFAAYDAAGGGEAFAPVVIPEFASVGDCIEWCATQRNDLELAATRLVPEISEVLQELGSLEGVGLARMSGSGATCFALFETQKEAQGAQARLKSAHPDWWIRCTHLS